MHEFKPFKNHMLSGLPSKVSPDKVIIKECSNYSGMRENIQWGILPTAFSVEITEMTTVIQSFLKVTYEF